MKLPLFFIYFLLYAIVVIGMAYGLQYLFATDSLLSPYFWIINIVLFILTLSAYAISDLGFRNGGEVSIYSMMGGIFVKMIFSLILIAVLVIKYPENKLLTAINFFYTYIFFTAFEVTCLLRNLRDQNKTQKIGDR